VFSGIEKGAVEELTGFRQDENFYYLTGVNEPGAAVLIAPAVEAKAGGEQTTAASGRPTPTPRPYSEVLLLPRHNLARERWDGKKLGPDDPDASSATGFERVVPLDRLYDELTKVLPNGGGLLVNQGPTAQVALDWLQRTNLPLYTRDVKPLLASLRMVKDAGEIALIRKATDASAAAHLAAMKAMKPGIGERQISALMQYEFERRGCERPAYGPIVGAGFNSTVLHYDADSGPINDGDVVVMDVAGEYSGYASDITRTLPASGHFTRRQREIYDIVLGAQQAAIAAFKAGKSVLGGLDHPDSLQKAAYDYINTHGADLHGKPLGQYFIHGVGHHVGLDVHDPGEPGKPLDKGMVFTLEPGIYIPDEKLGVRIEDLFWVNDSGNLVRLSDPLPRAAEEVEKMMAK
jgi:Xaa-Pro aminopeptidase